MTIAEQIHDYIARQPEQKRADLETLHHLLLEQLPGCALWFLDGTDASGKIVSNPNIGYGSHTIAYADGSSRPFYSIGLSANTGGISVYILGIADKTYLAQTYGAQLGKARVTGYCIKFKSLKDISVAVLLAAIQYGVSQAS